jgi:hypothetical protein
MQRALLQEDVGVHRSTLSRDSRAVDAGAEPGRLFFGSSNVMMKAEVREAGALEQYVTGSFLARTWARGANASEIELMYAETVRGQSRF